MTRGKSYLIHGGEWHSFVGKYIEQVSPLLHSFSHVSKVCDTNSGDTWHELCQGNGRDAAEFLHSAYGRCEMPISIAAFPWKGETPMEAAGIAWEDDH